MPGDVTSAPPGSAVSTVRRLVRGTAAFINEHPVVPVLLVAALVRAAVAVAYRPALFFTDSWAYIDAAYSHWPVAFRADRPSGYPLVLRLLSVFGRELTVVTVLQHLAGLATGLLAYILMVRLGVRRWIAAAGAAVIMLDAYAIAVEQHVMAEAFFALALISCVFLAAAVRPTWATLAGSGATLAVATTLRTSAVFALPILALFWLHVAGLRKAALGGLGFMVPLVCYFGLQATAGERIGLNEASGWFLYGRVAELANCRHATVRRAGEKLCSLTLRERDKGPAFHVWNPASAPHRLYGGMDNPEANRMLRRFAVAVIRDRPRAYARLVAGDVARYFYPQSSERHNGSNAISFPSRGKLNLRTNGWVISRRQHYFPELTGELHPPAAPLGSYQRIFRAPHLLLAALTLVALLGVVLGTGRRWETLLLAGVALSILVGSTATSAFILRYVVPLTPLLVSAGAVSSSALWRRYRRRPPVVPV